MQTTHRTHFPGISSTQQPWQSRQPAPTWVLVRLWIVVMQPCTMPSFSSMTLMTGAMQLVVHDAAVTMWSFEAS